MSEVERFSMASKAKSKKRKRSGSTGKFFIILFFLGFGLFLFSTFRHDIMKSFKPKEVKQSKEAKQSTPEKKKSVVLYFSDGEGEFLIGEKRAVSQGASLQEEAKEVVIELIHGPSGRLIPTLPPKTKLIALQVDHEGLAKVNFNRSLTQDHPGGSSAEIMTVYSVVNSLALNFPEIKRVQILVEGKEIETITGHLSLNKPMAPNPKLIKKTEKM
jgi:spore germination protein GerM